MSEQLDLESFIRDHARTNDPHTSKAAARFTEKFWKAHAGRILTYLQGIYPGGATTEEIGAAIGLTHVQIGKRLPDLEQLKLAKPYEERKLSSGVSGRVWRSVSR